MSNIQTGAERMPHDLSHLGFLAGQIGRLITIDRKSGSAGMPRPISYAVFCLKKKKQNKTTGTSKPGNAVHGKDPAISREQQDAYPVDGSRATTEVVNAAS